ncbi:MAG TPA: N-6 DNA methylase [Pseudonocardiaceae bacterium]|nr:N-6 DNA methylase [Pseudonocardiaceae bacterium]
MDIENNNSPLSPHPKNDGNEGVEAGSALERVAPGTRARPPVDVSVGHDVTRIAEAVAQAWHRADHSGRLDVPISVVATIALVSTTGRHGRDHSPALTEWITGDFTDFAHTVWPRIAVARPDLVEAMLPLFRWLFDTEQTHLLPRAQQVAQAAVRAGQLALTGTDRRFDVDLLGVTLTELRPAGARNTRGQFFTPAPIAESMASLLQVNEQHSVADPAVGTGGMFRAVANMMRTQGHDPATVTWVGNDTDEIAVGCAAVNALVWELGERVVLWVGDSLAAEDGYTAALHRRAEMIELAGFTRQVKTLQAALETLTPDPKPSHD